MEGPLGGMQVTVQTSAPSHRAKLATPIFMDVFWEDYGRWSFHHLGYRSSPYRYYYSHTYCNQSNQSNQGKVSITEADAVSDLSTTIGNGPNKSCQWYFTSSLQPHKWDSTGDSLVNTSNFNKCLGQEDFACGSILGISMLQYHSQVMFLMCGICGINGSSPEIHYCWNLDLYRRWAYEIGYELSRIRM